MANDQIREAAIVAGARALNADETYGELVELPYVPHVAALIVDAVLAAVTPLIEQAFAERAARVVERGDPIEAALLGQDPAKGNDRA